MIRQIILAITSVFSIISLFGCATTGSYTSSGAKITDVKVALKNGDIRPTCAVSCSGTNGYHHGRRKIYYDSGLWFDLAVDVVKVGFESDQNYYYLGRSAEGLGYFDAALAYYKLAKTETVFKCDNLVNNCDGLVFPKDIDERLMLVEHSSKDLKNKVVSTDQPENTPMLMGNKSNFSEPPVFENSQPTLNKLKEKQFKAKKNLKKKLVPSYQTGELE